MKVYFKLFRQFILRAVLQERVRSSVTVLGISLGIGVMIAIRLANASSLESFRAATESIAGETSVQITGVAGRFDELLARDLGWLREYGQISPVIAGHATALLPSSSGAAENKTSEPRELLQVLGVDVLRDTALRKYRLLRLTDDDATLSTSQFLLLLTDPAAVVITERLALRHNLAIGNSISLVIGDTRREFTVRGLLLNEGPARVLDGNFALMDIAAAQFAFSRLGLLDRVDIKLKAGIPLERAESEISNRLPEGLVVVRPEQSYGQIETMIAAFHFNLSALGSIALLVGLFLIYNTVSISVITRREEIGALRAVGAGRRVLVMLFLGEATLFALVGATIGLALGRVMANAAVRLTATTVDTFYIASAATGNLNSHPIGPPEILLAFAVALPLSLMAAALPAIEASRVKPIEAMRGAERLTRALKPSLRNLAIAITLFLFAYLLSRMDAVNGLPIFGYAAALALVFGGAFLVPGLLWVACRIPGRATGLVRIFRVEAKLAAANLKSAIGRISISVAALAASLAMMAAISIMIGSFRETVTYWLNQTLTADLYAKAFARSAALAEGEIDERAVEIIRADRDVAAVDSFTSKPVSYDGSLITLGAGDFEVLLKHGRLLFKEPSNASERIRDAIGRDEVVVSESFALRFRRSPGDSILLPTPEGLRPFRVQAVYYDYSSNRGTVVMDIGTYVEHFSIRNQGADESGVVAKQTRVSSLNIYLKPGSDPADVKARLERQLAGVHELIFTTNASVRGEVMRIFDSTFAITYALELIAIVVAGLGVISTLITLILERRRELAILRFLGATRMQIRKMIAIEAVTIGGVSQLLGIAIGSMLSLLLIYVVNVQSFGWTIQYDFPGWFLVRSTLLILLASLLAGLYPAAGAAGVDPVQFAREE